MARIARNTAEARATVIVERDLAIHTGAELTELYGKADSAAAQAFERVTGKPVAEIAPSHNPFWHYLLRTWYAQPTYRKLLYLPRHRDEVAAGYLRLALGELDKYDGFHHQYPRRALKSFFLKAFVDWVPKRHKIVDGLDILVLFSHNLDRRAKGAMESVKNMNRHSKYIKAHFPEFAIPEGEWGTKEEWDWPCRSADFLADQKSITVEAARSRKAGGGYNYKCLDDWEDEESRESAVVREDLADRYDQLRQLNAPPWSREVSCGTPYCLQSLYKPMLESKHEDGTPRYFVVRTPALADDNVPNFPTIPKLSVAALAKERANEIRRRGNDRFWYLQYQLDPTLTGDQAMQWEWFQELKRADYKKEWDKLPHFRACFVDPAWKGEQDQGEGCDTAIGMIDIYHRGEFYDYVLLDGVVSNEFVSDEGAEEMCRLMNKWGTPYYIIEQTADKPHVGMMRQVGRNQSPPMFPRYIDIKRWTGKAKEKRISAVAGSARMGHWYYLEADGGDRHYAALLSALQVQTNEYPGAVKKDILDMMANAHSDDVLRSWVPVSQQASRWREEIDRGRFAPATRYTGLPALVVH